jgi:putative ABC transport system permease protein
MFARMVRQSLIKSARVTAWSLATLTASAALATLFFTISLDVGDKMATSLRSLGANAMAHPAQSQRGTGEQPGTPQWDALEQLAKSQGAEIVTLEVRVGSVQGLPVAVVDADPRALERMTPYWAMTGRRGIGVGQCVVGRKLADALKVKPETDLELQLVGGRDENCRVAGVFESGDEDENRVFVGDLQDEPPAPAVKYALLSVPGGEAEMRAFNEALTAKALGIQIQPLRQVIHGEQAVLQKINFLAGLSLIAVLVLSAVGVTAAVLSRVIERRKELALLQALGAKRRSVAAFLLCEGAGLGVAAAVLGYGVGTLLAQAVVQQIFRVSVTPRLTAFLAALGITVVMALFAASMATRRALRMEPAVLLKGE